jgi:hypothetical protein
MAGERTALKVWNRARISWIDGNIPNTGACEDWDELRLGTLIADVYPNPLDVNNTIIVKVKNAQPVYLQVTDVMGRTMYSKTINAVPVSNAVTDIHTETWAPGMYIFTFSNNAGEKITKKIIR